MYNNGSGKDSFILLELYYRDGDGDVGLDPGDTMPPFNAAGDEFYNLKVWMLEKKNGKWVKPINPLSIPPDTLNFHERIQRITPTGRAKWIEGMISLNVLAEPYGLKPDTVMVQARLTDRSLKRSALVSSDIIVLRH